MKISLCFSFSYQRLLQLDDTIKKKKLSRHQVNSIKEISFRSNANNTDEENKCSVCLENFEENQPLRQFPCQHVYHKHCADQWLRVSIHLFSISSANNFNNRDFHRKIMFVQYVESLQLILIRNHHHHHRILLVVVTMTIIKIRIVIIIIIPDNLNQIIFEVQQIDNIQTIVQQCLPTVNLVVDMDMDIHLHHRINVLRDTYSIQMILFHTRQKRNIF